ncbi:hypothetical protein CR513_06730, partial [Mucuna pruriens]
MHDMNTEGIPKFAKDESSDEAGSISEILFVSTIVGAGPSWKSLIWCPLIWKELFTVRPKGERTQTCKEEELGCSDRPGAASDPRCSSHLRYGGEMGSVICECGGVRVVRVMLRALVVPSFEEARGYDPDGAADWIFEVEKIFQGMECPLVQKYFPHDILNKKQVEFLELKQRDDTVADYVSKFEALVRFCPTYEGAVNEEAKCVKFISSLRPEIK